MLLRASPLLFRLVASRNARSDNHLRFQAPKPAFTATVVERVPKKSQKEIDLDMEMQSVYGAIAQKNLEGVEPGMVGVTILLFIYVHDDCCLPGARECGAQAGEEVAFQITTPAQSMKLMI